MRQHGNFENSDDHNRHFLMGFRAFFSYIQKLVPKEGFSTENLFLHQFLSQGVPREALAKPQKPRRAKLENRKK